MRTNAFPCQSSLRGCSVPGKTIGLHAPHLFTLLLVLADECNERKVGQALRARRRRVARRTTGRLLNRRTFVPLAIALLILVVLQRTWGGADGSYAVVSVVDGDTVKVRMNGVVESVRLIGIDAPETNAPGRPVQCFGPAASAKAAELLGGQTVRLEFDESQGRRDRFDRLLAYVWVGDVLANEWMIRQGFAREFTFNEPYRYQQTFQMAEAKARAAGRGLWAADTCGGGL